MNIFNKILHNYAMCCRKEMVKILKCYLIPKKVMAICPRVQFFLANPVVLSRAAVEKSFTVTS